MNSVELVGIAEAVMPLRTQIVEQSQRIAALEAENARLCADLDQARAATDTP